MKLLEDIRSALWLARLLRRIGSREGLPRDQWFVGAADADVQWLAGESVPTWADEDCRYLLLEARREQKRRTLQRATST